MATSSKRLLARGWDTIGGACDIGGGVASGAGDRHSRAGARGRLILIPPEGALVVGRVCCGVHEMIMLMQRPIVFARFFKLVVHHPALLSQWGEVRLRFT